MIWTSLFFQYEEQRWNKRAEKAKDEGNMGHRCYAMQRMDIWRRFKEEAKGNFDKLLDPLIY